VLSLEPDAGTAAQANASTGSGRQLQGLRHGPLGARAQGELVQRLIVVVCCLLGSKLRICSEGPCGLILRLY
jgi:hypothetical protein